MSLAARRGRPAGLNVSTQNRAAVAIQKRIEAIQQPFESMYQQTSVIHDGGEQCTILKCKNTQDGVEYVVKRQNKRRIRGANQALFRRMTERMMNLPDSENMVKIYACYENSDYFYTILEACYGGDLFDFFRLMLADEITDEILEREVRVVMREMLISLAYLHNQGLVHKDVKLENLVFKHQVGGGGAGGGPTLSQPKPGDGPGSPKVLKLIDFDFTDEWEPNSPKSKAVVGTDGYIAPEAYVGDVCPASDVFSAAVVMYVLIAGRFPLPDEIFDDGPNENYVGSPKMKEIYGKMKKEFDKGIRFGRAWTGLQEAAEFCKAIMDFDCNKRLTAAQALEHPWITQAGK